LWLFVTNKTTWMPFFVALMYLVYRQYGLGNMLIILALIVVMITVTDQLANFFKSGFERPRPCREEHLKEIIRYIAPRCGHYGFFSAHAANSMALAVFLGVLFRKIHKSLGLLLLFLSVIVSFSRIYLGVHYPLDTLTGWVIGALAGFLAYKLSCWINLSRPRGFFGQGFRYFNGHGSVPRAGRRQAWALRYVKEVRGQRPNPGPTHA
jgi:undecaprenyl-diphosphatase